MQGTLFAAVFLLLPVLLVVFLRTNAAILFFVLAGATTLQTYLDKDVASFAGSLFGGSSTQMVSFVLLVVPFIVAALAFRHTIAKRMLVFHVLLALVIGVCLVTIVPQFLPESLKSSVLTSAVYAQTQPFTSVAIAASFMASVVAIWINRPKHQEHGGHKKHGH
jgi:hypothetical protein